MRVAFDTSVILAGSIAGHVHQDRAAAWFAAAQAGRFTAGATPHALAETWATATALPLEPPIAPALVQRMIDRFRSKVEILDLSWEDYHRAMQRCSDRGLRSGVVYDALHLVAAERWEAQVLLTFNLQDFERLATSGSPHILAPPDPPDVEAVLRSAEEG
jgi:predicted nucleic acid-binding protein